MDRLDAQKLALRLMAGYKLIDDGWTFAFCGGHRRCGACSPRIRTISLCVTHTIINPVWEVEDTIRHEIAHALAWKCTGVCAHDESFYAMCHVVGAEPNIRTSRCLIAHNDGDDFVYGAPQINTTRDTLVWASLQWPERYLNLRDRLPERFVDVINDTLKDRILMHSTRGHR